MSDSGFILSVSTDVVNGCHAFSKGVSLQNNNKDIE